MDISGIDFLGIDRVIKRSTAEIIEQNDNALLVFDKVSKAYMPDVEVKNENNTVYRKRTAGRAGF